MSWGDAALEFVALAVVMVGLVVTVTIGIVARVFGVEDKVMGEKYE